MLAKRIIPCLDVRDDQVVKGVQFRQHQVVGDIIELAKDYSEQGADELVFYDITASADRRRVSSQWVRQVAQVIQIPFCVAGGINSIKDAYEILNAGADKISLNSPALARPDLINDLAGEFGRQCVVIGVDSCPQNGQHYVYQLTGREETQTSTTRKTLEWISEVQERGAGEIVLNCMNEDGRRQGYEIEHLKNARQACQVPLIASGGAGSVQHFIDVFKKADVSGALAASVFHRKVLSVSEVKWGLEESGVCVR